MYHVMVAVCVGSAHNLLMSMCGVHAVPLISQSTLPRCRQNVGLSMDIFSVILKLPFVPGMCPRSQGRLEAQ